MLKTIKAIPAYLQRIATQPSFFVPVFACAIFLTCPAITLAQSTEPQAASQTQTNLKPAQHEELQTPAKVSLSPLPTRTRDERAALNDSVLRAFAQTHDGWSSDEVIIRQSLNDEFINGCLEKFPEGLPAEFNWTLIRLRKAGKLTTKSTKRSRVDTDSVIHVAQIAIRSIQDQYQVSSDRIMTDPELRTEFDDLAQSIAPEADRYLVRRAALALRKTRRLKPELITRVADWDREIRTVTAAAILNAPSDIPKHPGIYIFRDKTGYLYIGQTENLQERLLEHLDQSHNASLATYLKEQGTDLAKVQIEIHSFDPKSQARKTMVRRAYESELIRSRKPRFNIQP